MLQGDNSLLLDGLADKVGAWGCKLTSKHLRYLSVLIKTVYSISMIYLSNDHEKGYQIEIS